MVENLEIRICKIEAPLEFKIIGLKPPNLVCVTI